MNKKQQAKHDALIRRGERALSRGAFDVAGHCFREAGALADPGARQAQEDAARVLRRIFVGVCIDR